jgi:hypothetical protein
MGMWLAPVVDRPDELELIRACKERAVSVADRDQVVAYRQHEAAGVARERVRPDLKPYLIPYPHVFNVSGAASRPARPRSRIRRPMVELAVQVGAPRHVSGTYAVPTQASVLGVDQRFRPAAVAG